MDKWKLEFNDISFYTMNNFDRRRSISLYQILNSTQYKYISFVFLLLLFILLFKLFFFKKSN